MVRYRYTPEALADAAARSRNVTEVLRLLGVRLSGGSHAHVSRQLKRFGIDTSHFSRRPLHRVSRGRRTSAADLLVRLADGSRRTPGVRLKWALSTIGVPEQCEECGLGPRWQGRPLILHVDHVNGDFLDNRPPNLRLLCPNCHSQTATYAGRNRRPAPLPLGPPGPGGKIEPSGPVRPLTPPEIEALIRQVAAGEVTAVEAARRIGCHRNHVYRIRHRLDETGTVTPRPRVAGRNAEDAQLVVRFALANPTLGPRKLAELIRTTTGGRARPSHGTVSNVLRDAGLNTVKARRTRLSGQAGVV
ncbi:helix-turn-helix domain-containing protein [Micromonospora sp. WMMD882]|uniref:helix-turn-helix domain-containing protein n=1 Tax=Micromonospora sp. WMMD882 TaxID=3015151 RepID=UPI00248C9C07|nr:helix-turn-helix domain-containing protein [Micromonospora sp. WMMD882]WBB82164.1 helix-turn-helix domain-containing protein [Micromonospora sp. WMMD882]